MCMDLVRVHDSSVCPHGYWLIAYGLMAPLNPYGASAKHIFSEIGDWTLTRKYWRTLREQENKEARWEIRQYVVYIRCCWCSLRLPPAWFMRRVWWRKNSICEWRSHRTKESCVPFCDFIWDFIDMSTRNRRGSFMSGAYSFVISISQCFIQGSNDNSIRL